MLVAGGHYHGCAVLFALLSSWFAVHCTSMNNTNSLVSSDNKGVASFLMEQYVNGPGTRVGQVKNCLNVTCICAHTRVLVNLGVLVNLCTFS